MFVWAARSPAGADGWRTGNRFFTMVYAGAGLDRRQAASGLLLAALSHMQVNTWTGEVHLPAPAGSATSDWQQSIDWSTPCVACTPGVAHAAPPPCGLKRCIHRTSVFTQVSRSRTRLQTSVCSPREPQCARVERGLSRSEHLRGCMQCSMQRAMGPVARPAAGGAFRRTALCRAQARTQHAQVCGAPMSASAALGQPAALQPGLPPLTTAAACCRAR